MSDRSAAHATFAIERVYDALPARVFQAWADPAAKARWFGPAEMKGSYELDFRIGGLEHLSLSAPDGPTYTFDARYQDIVPDERIVYAYDMHRDETRISVSLATVELAPAGGGTRLLFTEQSVFLDGQDTPAERERGTGTLLENLDAELQGERV
jgi:uncharacterized protein YndB with AHSA1/START domain